MWGWQVKLCDPLVAHESYHEVVVHDDKYQILYLLTLLHMATLTLTVGSTSSMDFLLVFYSNQ